MMDNKGYNIADGKLMTPRLHFDLSRDKTGTN